MSRSQFRFLLPVVVSSLANVSLQSVEEGKHLRLQLCVTSETNDRLPCSHTPWAGAANIENGTALDLSNLNQILVAEDKSTVTVGPGNSWHRVYNEVVPRGIVVGGGRVAIVGVGGLVLGGEHPCHVSMRSIALR